MIWLPSGGKPTPEQRLLPVSKVVLKLQSVVFQRSTPPETGTANSVPSGENARPSQPSLSRTVTGVRVCPLNDQTLTSLPDTPPLVAAVTRVLPSGEKAAASISVPESPQTSGVS